jgi:hypothetical protein
MGDFMIPVIIGGVVVIAAAAAAKAHSDGRKKKKKACFDGDGVRERKLVLMGPRQVGKTTWFTFLTKGTIPKGYKPTLITEEGRYKPNGDFEPLKNDQNLSDLGFDLKLTDLAGAGHGGGDGFAMLDEWKRHYQTADFVFFLVDVTKLSDATYRDRAVRMASQVQMWGSEKVSPVVYVLASHADLDAQWCDGDGYTDIQERSELHKIKQILGAKFILP